MCDPRDLNRRSASAVAGPDHAITGTDTLLGACPVGAECIAAGKKHNQLSYFFLRERERAECELRSQDMFFFIHLYCFILIHNVLVQTLSFEKAHLRPPRPPRRRKTGGVSPVFIPSI